MAVYISTLVIITFFSAIYYRQYLLCQMPLADGQKSPYQSRQTQIICAFLIGLVLFAVSALRYNVGTDYGNYKMFMSRAQLPGWEPGYVALIRFIEFFTPSYEVFIAVNGAIFVILFLKGFKDYTQFHPVAIYLFFCMGTYFQSFCLLRQSLSMAVVFIAYRYVISKEYGKLLLFFLLAALLHSSALIVAPAFFLSNLKLPRSYYLVGFGGGLVLSPVFYLLGKWYIHKRYFGWLDSSVDKLLPIYSILLGLLIFLLAFLYRSQLLRLDEYNNSLINICFFYMIYAIGFGFVPTLSRCFQYFIPFIAIIVTRILQCEQNLKVRRLFYLIVFSGYFVFMVIFALLSDSGVTPYQTLFSK